MVYLRISFYVFFFWRKVWELLWSCGSKISQNLSNIFIRVNIERGFRPNKNIVKKLDQSNHIKCETTNEAQMGQVPIRKQKNINTRQALKILPNSFKSCCIKYSMNKFERTNLSSFVFLWPSQWFSLESESFFRSYVIEFLFDPYFSNFPYFSAKRQILQFWHFHFQRQNLPQICFITFKTEYLAPLSRKGPSEIHIEITTASIRVLYHLQCSGNQLFLSSASAVLLLVSF